MINNRQDIFRFLYSRYTCSIVQMDIVGSKSHSVSSCVGIEREAKCLPRPLKRVSGTTGQTQISSSSAMACYQNCLAIQPENETGAQLMQINLANQEVSWHDLFLWYCRARGANSSRYGIGCARKLILLLLSKKFCIQVLGILIERCRLYWSSVHRQTENSLLGRDIKLIGLHDPNVGISKTFL